jgi:hypothetical protein
MSVARGAATFSEVNLPFYSTILSYFLFILYFRKICQKKKPAGPKPDGLSKTLMENRSLNNIIFTVTQKVVSHEKKEKL